MSWTKTETLSNTPDASGRKNVVETWSLKDRDGVDVAVVSKDADDAVTLEVGGSEVTATQLSNLVTYGNPTGVKVYRALLTQTGTDAPVATVRENTLGGTVVWGYSNAGDYTATLAGAFTVSKTFISVTNGKLTTGGGGLAIVAAAPIDANTVGLVTGDQAGTLTDALLLDASLKILVYP